MEPEQNPETLVKRFVEGVVKHREYMCTDHRVANQNFDKYTEALKGLFLLGEPGMNALLRLLDDSRPVVRVSVGTYLLRIFPERAIKVLQAEVDQKGALLSSALVALKRWERGIYLDPFRGEMKLPPKKA